MAAEFPAEAGLLVTSERQLARAIHESVHPHRTGPHAASDRQARIEIAAPDACGQAVIDRVGNLDGFCGCLKGQNRKDRSENLFTRNRHSRRDVGKNGRRHELPHSQVQFFSPMSDLCAAVFRI
ncbi:hypothetical protein D3C86_1450040 [compost metagenome]